MATRDLLSDPDVARYYRNRCAKSRKGADALMFRLSGFCKWAKMTPKDLTRTKHLDDLLERYVTDREGQVSGATILVNLTAVKTWLNFCKVKDVTLPSIPNPRSPTGASPPDTATLDRMLNSMSLRGRITAMLTAYAGLRPGVYAAYRGGDVLRLKDLPELDMETLTFKEVPFVIRVRAELSKSRHAYITFGPDPLADF